MAGDESGSATSPLAGVRVIEFTHMVMGPAVGAILADLGAEVNMMDGCRILRYNAI